MSFANSFYTYRRHFFPISEPLLSRSSLRHNLRVSSSLQPSTYHISSVCFPRLCLPCVTHCLLISILPIHANSLHLPPSCLIPSFFVSLFSSCHQFICQLPPLVAFVTVSSCLSCLACPCPYPMHVLHSSLLLFSSSTPLLLQLILFHCLSCSVPSPLLNFILCSSASFVLPNLSAPLPVRSFIYLFFYLCFVLFLSS